MRLILVLIVILIVNPVYSQVDSLKAIPISDTDSLVIIIDPIESMPVFPGGLDSLFSILERELDFEIINGGSESGFVYVKGVIDTSGLYGNFSMNWKDIPDRFKLVQDTIIYNEIRRVLSDLPLWSPAKQYNQKVRCNYYLRIPIPYNKTKSFKLGSYTISEKSDSSYHVTLNGKVYIDEIEKERFLNCTNKFDSIQVIRSFKRYGDRLIIPIANGKDHLDRSDRLYLRDNIEESELYEFISQAIGGLNLFILLNNNGTFEWEACGDCFNYKSSGKYIVVHDSIVILNPVSLNTPFKKESTEEKGFFPKNEFNFKNRIYILREGSLYNVNPSCEVKILKDSDWSNHFSKLIGSSYLDLCEIELKKFYHGQGFLLDSEVNDDYGITTLIKSDTTIVLFTKTIGRTPEGKAEQLILDVDYIVGDYYLSRPVDRNGKIDKELVAFVVYEDQEKFENIKRVYRANRLNEKLEVENKTSIVCWNMEFGVEP
ncbi:hypothetical protein [Marinifilum caeruleilacunae]|uniref:Uncharacterized protein n=1 Tax=Marinifilum caeruleilacunae TaxID=2499076 RepID=A0ABX1X1E7_9BACT|nr:hypothetical protein [Marinifilum caeruleilacunae]NOU62234.1 hypothetical protein [Marinifilum caeruleilacunae]